MTIVYLDRLGHVVPHAVLSATCASSAHVLFFFWFSGWWVRQAHFSEPRAGADGCVGQRVRGPYVCGF